MGMGIREYAAHRGVSHVAVLKALKSGRIQKNADGKIDPIEADAAWERNTNPAQQRKPAFQPATQLPVAPDPQISPIRQSAQQPAVPGMGPGMAAVPNYQVSRAIRETYNAKIARLEYEVRTGKLLNAEDVCRDAFALARRIRDRLMGVPCRVASILAPETDSKVVERLLTQELLIALEELPNESCLQHALR